MFKWVLVNFSGMCFGILESKGMTWLNSANVLLVLSCRRRLGSLFKFAALSSPFRQLKGLRFQSDLHSKITTGISFTTTLVQKMLICNIKPKSLVEAPVPMADFSSKFTYLWVAPPCCQADQKGLTSFSSVRFYETDGASFKAGRFKSPKTCTSISIIVRETNTTFCFLIICTV